MSQIGVHGFAAGDDEKDGSQSEKAVPPAIDEKSDGVDGVERLENGRMLNDVKNAECAHGYEPEQHDRPEEAADPARAAALQPKQCEQDDDGDRHDIGVEYRGNDLESFEGAEYGYGGGENAVAVEQGRTKQPKAEDERPFELRFFFG